LKEALRTLETSEDRSKVTGAALFICGSKDKQALESLAKNLNSSRLHKLLFHYYDLNEGAVPEGDQILEVIGGISAPEAEAVLVKLARDEQFTDEGGRKWAVLKAMGNLKNPSPQALDVLDKAATPDSSMTPIVLYACAKIGTKKSVQLIEKRLLSNDDYSKIGSLENYIFLFRTNDSIVSMYNRLLHAQIKDDALRDAAVQSLFDYRPKKWFGWNHPGEYPKPPAWKDASTETLKDLVALADHCLTLAVPTDTKAAVEKSKKEIESILAERKSEKK
jgi:hypothetical protein